MIAYDYVPIIVMPHPPQVGQQVGVCRGFVTQNCPQGRGICTTTLKALNITLNAIVQLCFELYKGTHSYKLTDFKFPHLIPRAIIADL